MWKKVQSSAHAATQTCKKNELRIVTVLSMVLIAVASFALGMMTFSAREAAPMVIEYDAEFAQVALVDTADEIGEAAELNGAGADAQNCMYVGSKNSTKYYPPTCSFANRIAPENLRCFTSDEDAQNKGYTRSTGC